MKILIIEDDVFFQKFYANKLTENGFQVEIAGDGDEGLTKIRSFMPDLIVLDIILPKKDGFMLLSEIQQDPVIKQIPVLVFSTLGQESDIQKALALGAKDYVNKSFFDFNNFLTKIKNNLKTTQSQSQSVDNQK